MPTAITVAATHDSASGTSTLRRTRWPSEGRAGPAAAAITAAAAPGSWPGAFANLGLQQVAQAAQRADLHAGAGELLAQARDERFERVVGQQFVEFGELGREFAF